MEDGAKYFHGKVKEIEFLKYILRTIIWSSKNKDNSIPEDIAWSAQDKLRTLNILDNTINPEKYVVEE